MNILVINPNSSTEMTDHLRVVLTGIKRVDTNLTVVPTKGAPAAIESACDVASATIPMLELIRKANEEDHHAIILACFADPGLEAAREVSNALVLGIQQTSLHVAAMLGHRFTVLTMTSSRVPAKEQDIRRFKLESSLASVRPLGLSVAEIEAQPERTEEQIRRVSRLAVEEDGAEVIVLGCAGMAGYARDVERELGIVVLDPSAVTLKVCEALLDLGVRQSKKGLYATPPH